MPVSTDNPALALLLERRSHHHLVAPGPDAASLALILAAAERVPDFQGLRPYRFLLAEGEGRVRLGAMMQRAAQAAGKSEKAIQRAPSLPLRAPLVIVVVASPKPSKVATPLDQLLCAGSTVLTMQLAALALGLGGIWRSGWLMEDPHFFQELGLAPTESLVGFLYLGSVPPDPTPAQEPVAPKHADRPASASTVWL